MTKMRRKRMRITEFKIIVEEGIFIPDFGKLGSIVRIMFDCCGEEHGTFLRFGDETLDQYQIAEAGEVLIYQASRMLAFLRNGYPSVSFADSSPCQGSHETKGE